MSGTRLVLPSQQPVQSSGLPYAGGQLFFYVSGTTTLTPTYQDQALSIPNTNPVVLDSAGNVGNVFLNPSIIYKIVLEDDLGNQVWTFDPVSSFAPGTIQALNLAGTTTGSANSQYLSGLPAVSNGQTIIFTAGYTNTASATLNTGAGNVFFYAQSVGGAAALTGGEIQAGNSYIATFFSALNSGAGGWQLMGAQSLLGLGGNAPMLPVVQAASLASAYAALGGALPAPSGRLTLSSGIPVLSSAVIGSSSVIYTPYNGNQIPVWNAAKSTWSISAFSELTCLLSDATLSPAAAAANSLYDLFVWANSGALVLSRGPVWTNATTRALAVSRVNGFLTNSSAITNGPVANVGVYVGTIATDSGAATVSFNPAPAAASGGPSGGAWLGLWNQYNRISVFPLAQDNKAGWTYASATWRPADNSANNRITFVHGQAEDSFVSIYEVYGQSGSVTNYPSFGIGLDSTTSPNVISVVNGSGSSGAQVTSVANLFSLPVLGQHYAQALESVVGSASMGSLGTTQILATLKY